MTVYDPNVPTGIVPLNQDYKNLQGNFSKADTSFGTDHVAFSINTNRNGYHKVIHLVPFSTTGSNPPNNYPVTPPATINTIGQLFGAGTNDGINTDIALMYLSGNGNLIQMTRNFVPTSAQNGATFLPGGLILQWGLTATVGGTYTVTFPQPFTAAPYSIVATAQSGSDRNAEVLFGATNISFQMHSSTGTVYWMAIGT